MIQEQLEGLAEKILEDALENIRRLGFQVIIMEKATDKSFWMKHPVDQKGTIGPKLFVISEERRRRGDY